MEAKINKVFIEKWEIPLTLISINDKPPAVFEQEFSKAGLQKHDFFISKFYGDYVGVNLVWQAMMQLKPEELRNYYKSCYKSEDSEIKDACTETFDFNEKGEVHFGKNDTWEKKGRSFFKTQIYDELSELLEEGIEFKIDEKPLQIDSFAGVYHFIGLEWIKSAYTKCYNEDNGIKEGCFITTAVCDNFNKPDDCYELTTFRNFRDNWLIHQEDGASLIQKYYSIAPAVVEKINALPNAHTIYLEIWTEFLKPCLTYLEKKNYIACKQKYIQMVESLSEKY